MNNILNLSPARRTDVQRLVNHISNSKILSPTSLNRLNKLVSLLDEKGYINYAEAYSLLFPKSKIDSKEKEKSEKAFSKFRTKLRTVTEKHQMPLVLCVDDNKTSENSTRCLWFECEDNDVKQRIEAHNKNYTYNLPIPMEYQKISIGNRKFPAENEQAIPFLVDWLSDPDGDVFCTVFGETGMGKTTLCQQ